MKNRIGFALTAIVLSSSAMSIAPNQAEARGSGTSRGCLSSSASALLRRIESQFGAMQIVSTCRPGARIAGTGQMSKHSSGNAIDFNAGRRKGQVLQWLISNHRSGGVMTYPGMDHIHVDIGQHFVSLSGGRRHASNASRSGRRYASASSSGSGRYASGRVGAAGFDQSARMSLGFAGN